MKLRIRLPKKIRFLVTPILLMIFFIAAVFALRVIRKSSHQEQQALVQSFGRETEKLAHALRSGWAQRRGELMRLAKTPELQSSVSESIIEALNQAIVITGGFDLFTLKDNEERLIAVNTVSPAGTPIDVGILYNADKQNEKPTRLKEEKAPEYIFEDLRLDPDLSTLKSREQSGMSFSTAIEDENGAKLGTLTGKSSVDWVIIQLQSTYREMARLGIPNLQIRLLNREMKTLISYDSFQLNKPGARMSQAPENRDWSPSKTSPKLEQVLLGRAAATLIDRDLLGGLLTLYAKDRVFDTESDPQPAWTVLISAPYEEAFENFNSYRANVH